MRATTLQYGSLLAVPLLACGLGESIQETVPVEPGGRLVVELVRGDLEIASHDANEVRIEGEAGGWDVFPFDFELDRQGDVVELTGDLDFWRLPFWLDLDVHVRAWVPRSYSVELHTQRGTVEVLGIGGAVVVESSRGGVRVERIDGEVSITTSRGDIQAKQVAGDLAAKTSRGAIEVDGVSGRVRAETSRGPIEISGGAGPISASTRRAPIHVRDAAGSVRATTHRAPIFVSFASKPEGELVTSRASIEVVVPEGAEFDLNAETSRGSVLLGEAIEVDGERARERTVGRVNGGGGELRLRTSRSEIRVDVR